MKIAEVPFNISLPLLGIGVFSLLLSLVFCCYMWRLRYKARQEQGYKRIQFLSSKKKKHPNDSCPVCLEDFMHQEYIARCRCQHCFHMKCLLEWLKHQNVCPMCKAPVQMYPRPGERTGLILQPRPPPPQTAVASTSAAGRDPVVEATVVMIRNENTDTV